jgi:hypothetical protein
VLPASPLATQSRPTNGIAGSRARGLDCSETSESRLAPVQDRSCGDATIPITMMYPTKTALVIRVDLLSWQIANVAAFLSGGLAGTYPEIVGEPYRDGDGRL